MKKSEKERGPNAQKKVQTKLDTKVRKDREGSGMVLYSNLVLARRAQQDSKYRTRFSYQKRGGVQLAIKTTISSS